MTTRFIPGEANGVKVTGRRGSVTVSVSASAEARAPLAVKLDVLGIRVLIQSLEEVQEAYALTGDADYLLKIAVPDLRALSRILNDVLLPHRTVAHVQSSIVLDRLKHTTRLPLRHLQAPSAKPRKRAAR